ncbi:MAG TPA: hypothetical protein VKZ56_03350 [Membranihabitans sp.]|nr:hypothetical protein [Membranihabitans sp.]
MNIKKYEESNPATDGNRFEIWTDDMEIAFDDCLEIIPEKLN